MIMGGSKELPFFMCVIRPLSGCRAFSGFVAILQVKSLLAFGA